MAMCSYCKQEMSGDHPADSCPAFNGMVEFPDGTKLPAIAYDEDGRGRCHDCNIKNGGFHHSGCDMERCPKCLGQLISCGCLEVSEEPVPAPVPPKEIPVDLTKRRIRC